MENENFEVEQTEISDAPKSKPARRGRPRKKEQIIDDNSPLSTEQAETEDTTQKTPVKRGRKSKKTLEVKQLMLEEQDIEPIEEKKRRTRRSKTLPSETQIEVSENLAANEPIESRQDNTPAQESVNFSPKPRTRRNSSQRAKPQITAEESNTEINENVYSKATNTAPISQSNHQDTEFSDQQNAYSLNSTTRNLLSANSENILPSQNYPYDNDTIPIQLLPTKNNKNNRQNQKDQRQNRGLSKNFFKRTPINSQNQQQNNFAQPENISQGTKYSESKMKNYHQPAFDNSSVIAAITGKTLVDNSYNYQDDNNYNQAQSQPQKKSRGNNQVKTLDNDISFLQPAQEQNNSRQNKRNSKKSTHYLQSNVLRDESVSPDLSLPPQFVESVFEENIPTSELVDAKPKATQRKTNKKKAKEQELNKSYEYLYDKVQEQSRHNEQLKMFVSVQPDEQVEVVLTENGTVVEYFVEMAHHAKIRGNIYKATIHNVDPNLQAAFINFGAEKNGFLQIDEVHPDYYLSAHVPTKNHRFPLVNKVLKPGQEMLVQIVKEPNGNKGAFLTTWISLAGRFLVLTPGQEQLGVSRKVTDPDERARLRAMLDGLNPGNDMGVIIRTAAANATAEELEADLDYLQKLWVDIVHRAHNATPVALIHQEVELTQRVVRDYLNEDVREIWTDDSQMADSIHDMASILYPQKKNFVKLYTETRQSLLERFNLQKQIDEITSREVLLPSGGRVTFDQTEALMAIDINSGKTQNKANFQAMVLQTNIEAAQAIARHLRLRDIGGQIVIDFIELRDKSTVKEVENIFKNSMRPDRARYEVGHISTFGLLELVRQRIGSSAISISTEPCPHCHGTGVRRNMEWQAQDALKEIARKARSEKSIKFVYTTDKELALYLLNHKKDRIAQIEEKLNLRIEIQCP